MKKRIHVNQHRIRININKPEHVQLPPIGVEWSSEKQYGRTVKIFDKAGEVVATLIYSPDKPLKCGARLWIETDSKVQIDDQEIRD